MIVPPDLVALKQREREREVANQRLAQRALCHRACCDPTRFDRLVRAIGFAPTTC